MINRERWVCESQEVLAAAEELEQRRRGWTTEEDKRMKIFNLPHVNRAFFNNFDLFNFSYSFDLSLCSQIKECDIWEDDDCTGCRWSFSFPSSYFTWKSEGDYQEIGADSHACPSGVQWDHSCQRNGDPWGKSGGEHPHHPHLLEQHQPYQGFSWRGFLSRCWGFQRGVPGEI